jgi:hypothetical protein
MNASPRRTSRTPLRKKPRPRRTPVSRASSTPTM